ncbi:MAG TPA: hypothetical protein PLT92_13660 [Ignavibacteriaceae bacterium]|nr:hypothetical protein [Ignavibacteriaceae bacterium]
MSKFKWMPILKTGTFKDKNGKVVTVNPEDLDRVISSTDLTSDPQLVVEHPKFDEIGFGAVAQLKRVGELLFALPKEVNEKFKKAVNDGKLPGRSVTLDEKTFALKNISFLPPEIKPAVAGLGDYSFSTSPSASSGLNLQLILPGETSSFADIETSNFEFAQYEISSWPFRNIRTIFRNLKNKWIEKFGKEEADELFPEWDIDETGNPPSVFEKNPTELKQFSQSINGDEMKLDFTKLPPEVKTAFDALEAEKGRVTIELQTATTKLTDVEKERLRNEVLQFCESDEVKLKIKPADKEKVVNLLMALKEKGVIEFSSTGSASKVEFNAFDFTKELIKNMPDVVELSEIATKAKASDPNVSEEVKLGKEIAAFVNTK